MIKKLWKLLTPILSAVIGIFMVNKFNIFSMMPFVPKEYSYEICITAYFAIVDVLLDWLKDLISSWVVNTFFSEIEVLISQQGIAVNCETDSVLNFNADDLAQANITVKIRGRKKHFKDQKLIINKPSFAEIQSNYRRREVQVVDDNYCVELSELFGNSESIECTQEFRLVFIQDAVDGDSSVKITPGLSKINKRIRFKHNNAELRAVRR